MIVLMMEKVPVSLRGELSRWMIEPKAGVFVGKVSAMVRDKLWQHTCSKVKSGSAILIYNNPTEQGFAVRTFGPTSREVIDMEGLSLIRVPISTRKGVKREKNEPIEPVATSE